ncbi:MAG: DUF2894 domain-containing protein [Spongiibacteraceae bacterium]
MTVSALVTQLASLRDADAHGLDVARLAYIDGLVSRAGHARPEVQAILQRKAEQALDAYIADNKILPPNSDDVQSVPGSTSESNNTLWSLKSLIGQLDNSPVPQDATKSALEQQLLQQECVLLGSATFSVASSDVEPKDTAEPLALKSNQKMQRGRQERSLEKRIELALAEAPDSPGPLNPQMLAVKALSNMRELSPQYLSRFVAYLDTLFWLEQAEGTAGAKKDKKPSKSVARNRKRRSV